MLLVRTGSWWESKVPPLVAIACFQALLQSFPARDVLPVMGALVISVALLASYAHLVNDVFDVDADARCGKPNSAAHLSVAGRVSRIMAFLLAGLTPWVRVELAPLALAVLGLIVLLPLAYSAPPLRLKERGAAGVVTDAVMAHAAPALFVSLLFAGRATEPRAGTFLFVALTTVWATCVGLRGILLHEILDLRNDQVAGVRTFVVDVGVDRTRAVCTRMVFPLEVCCLGVFLVVLTRLHVIAGASLLLYATVFQAARAYWHLPQDPLSIDPHRRTALFEFYVVWPPLILATALTFRDPWYAVLLLAHVWLFRSAVQRQLQGIAARIGPYVLKSGSVTRRFLLEKYRALARDDAGSS